MINKLNAKGIMYKSARVAGAEAPSYFIAYVISQYLYVTKMHIKHKIIIEIVKNVIDNHLNLFISFTLYYYNKYTTLLQ